MTRDCKYCQRLKFLNMLDEALFFVNADNFHISYINEKARRLYGYNRDETVTLRLEALVCIPKTAINRIFEQVRLNGKGKTVYHTMHRRKNGQMFNVEVNIQYMRLHGTNTFVLLVRDTTADMLLKDDVARAKKIQQRLLPNDVDNRCALIKSIYKPAGHISGDLFGYKWLDDSSIFGYICDVTGHGIATALQAATIRVLFEQAASLDLPIEGKLDWLNSNAMPYFVEESFAAAICFEIDFVRQKMTCCAGGINHFIAVRRDNVDVISIPGSFLGVTAKGEYNSNTFSISKGDSFYFLSDGLFDVWLANSGLVAANFELQYEQLIRLAASGSCRDDATALCMYIK